MEDVFKYVKDHTEIKAVAETYGLKINRQGKTLCLWHTDSHPSMSFKDSYYKCFSCDVGGDVISLTQKLFNLTPIEAVKKLSDDFGLGLDLKNDNSVDVSVIEGKRQNKELLVVFQDWIDKTSSDYSKLARYYWQNIQKNKPLTENDPLHPLYVQGIHQWERINYLLDILLKGTIEEKVGLYRSLNNMKGVKKIND